jgi:hypothetical protein
LLSFIVDDSPCDCSDYPGVAEFEFSGAVP